MRAIRCGRTFEPAQPIDSVSVKMRRISKSFVSIARRHALKPRSRFLHHATLHTATGAHPLALRIADRFTSRLCGLMLAPPLAEHEGLLLTRCSSIHSAFMRQNIDVVYLDRSDKVVRCVQMLKPWSASIAWAASQVLELASGSTARYAIAPGDQLRR